MPSPDQPRYGIGIDAVEVARIENLVGNDDARAGRLFTERELEHSRGRRRRFEHLAARFAAKEAVLKALGTGLTGAMRWTEVEIVTDESGQPSVELSGAVAEFAERAGVESVEISLTHTGELAMANALAVWKS